MNKPATPRHQYQQEQQLDTSKLSESVAMLVFSAGLVECAGRSAAAARRLQTASAIANSRAGMGCITYIYVTLRMKVPVQ